MNGLELQRRIAELEHQAAEAHRLVQAYRASTSWRLTEPLRAVATQIQRRTGRKRGPSDLRARGAASPATPGPVAVQPQPPSPGFSEEQCVAGAFWDGALATAAAILPRTAWWNDPPTIRHINRVVCGEPLDGLHAGFNRRLAALLPTQCPNPPRAISVGTGCGAKELTLLHLGIVGSFDCYEVSAGAVEMGRRLAAEQGMAGAMRFHNVDAFSDALPDDFDLVYWNNALHHMPDTAAAVAWSRDRLRPGGVFAIDDYVGASRFQHSSHLLDWANRMLAVLPDRLLRRPGDSGEMVPRVQMRGDPEWLARIDPTEAVDSANILPAVWRNIPNAEIIPTGGALYFAALNDAFHNFVSEEDLRLLDALLLADAAVAEQGETPYAVVLAVKA